MRSAAQAADWAEAQSTFTPVNNCLRAVIVAYNVLGQIEPLARADATATEAWDLAESQHPGDRNPPRGSLVCFPNWGAGKSGHIAIGLGGDRVRSTGIDSSAYFTGTIAQVATACGNRYAGWAGDFAGTPIDFTSTAGHGSTTFSSTPRKKPMNKVIIGFADTGSYYIYNTDPEFPAGRDRYTGINGTDHLTKLEGIYGPRITYASQGEFDVIRTKYGIDERYGNATSNPVVDISGIDARLTSLAKQVTDLAAVAGDDEKNLLAAIDKIKLTPTKITLS